MAAPTPETRCVAAPTAGLRCSEERKKSSLGLGVGGVVLSSESYGENFYFNLDGIVCAIVYCSFNKRLTWQCLIGGVN